MGQHFDRRRLWELLSELVAEKRTGTLYIKSDDAHAGVISLDKGDIASILYRSEFGVSAVGLLKQVSGGTSRFDPGAPGVHGGECPPTAEILKALAVPGEAALNGSPMSARHATNKFTFQEFLGELRGHLQDYIGPIAPMVVEGAVAELGPIEDLDRAESLISRLMTEIDDQGDASSFLSAAMSSLNKVQGSAR